MRDAVAGGASVGVFGGGVWVLFEDLFDCFVFLAVGAEED